MIRLMTETVHMDSTDFVILRELQNDARITNRELAKAAGIAPSTCLERVARLRRAGVILGYTALIDPAAVGRGLEAFLAIRVRPHRRPVVGPFVEHVRAQPETRALYHVAGPDDYLLHIATTGVRDLQRFVLDELTSQDVVAHVETTLIFQQWGGGPVRPAADSGNE